MMSSSGNISRVTGTLCGKFTCHRLIPHTKASDAELWCFLRSAPWINGRVNNREAGDLRRHRAHYDVIVTSGRSWCKRSYPYTYGPVRPVLNHRKHEMWWHALFMWSNGMYFSMDNACVSICEVGWNSKCRVCKEATEEVGISLFACMTSRVAMRLTNFIVN